VLPRTYDNQVCSIARALELVGDRWTILVIREAFMGTRRFEDFQRNLGCARNVLTDRLNRLVEEGILRKRLYQERPPRYEYRLTRKGVDLYVILIALMQWGNRWAPNPDGPAVVLRHRECGSVIEPVLACPECGKPVQAWDLEALPGPAMTNRVRDTESVAS
jgi:DNA-binding HxlR family transcriptional regulator